MPEQFLLEDPSGELTDKQNLASRFKQDPSIEFLHSRYKYIDGCLFYKIKPSTSKNMGDRAGSVDSKGYRRVKINNSDFKEHRIIWVLHYGAIPNGYSIDHIDNDPSNNKIENLRLATYQQNKWNTKAKHNSVSGLKGVTYDKQTKRWYAKIYKDGKYIYLGVFESKELAFEKYRQEAIVIHGNFVKF